MKFAFIDAEKANFSVSAMCRLFGVTRQGYYAFINRPPSARATEEAALQERVRQSFVESEGRYGSPRVLRDLRRDGVRTSKRRIERAMREQGLQARSPRRFRVTTAADPSHAVEPNVLDRNFTAERPDRRWVTDITYISTAAGWCYLAVILDLFSRAVVGWALDTTLSTQLPLDALNMAVRRRRPRPGLMHHSDRGCQYTSTQYRHELAELGVTVSMSRKGNCWDNAVAESFFKTIKEELVHRQRWDSKAQLRSALFEYIEVFYNRRRLHSAVGYKTPSEVELKYACSDAA
jgi:putative transposase